MTNGPRTVIPVRSPEPRRILVGERPAPLLFFMDAQPEFECESPVSDTAGGRSGCEDRKVKLSIRTARVLLLPPESASGEKPLDMLAVRVRAVDPCDSVKPSNEVILSRAC